MKIKFHNAWIEQMKSGDFPYHCKIEVLSFGRVDHQFCLCVFNFVMILET